MANNYNWNDQALSDYGFSPEEITRLKEEAGKMDSPDAIQYFRDQGWINTPKPQAPTYNSGNTAKIVPQNGGPRSVVSYGQEPQYQDAGNGGSIRNRDNGLSGQPEVQQQQNPFSDGQPQRYMETTFNADPGYTDYYSKQNPNMGDAVNRAALVGGAMALTPYVGAGAASPATMVAPEAGALTAVPEAAGVSRYFYDMPKALEAPIRGIGDIGRKLLEYQQPGEASGIFFKNGVPFFTP